MATYVSEMFDQVRDLINDASDDQVSFATKKLYLNRGIALLWPKVYKVASDSSITILTDTYDYALPVAVADGIVLSVELENDYGYLRFVDYDILDGDEDLAGVFRIVRNPDDADMLGYKIRIKYLAPCTAIAAATYVAAQSEAWVGPDRAIHLPVLYAMGMIAARKLDDRQDTTRYSTTQGQNGVTDGDIMSSSRMWFDQFYDELRDMERPLPIARD